MFFPNKRNIVRTRQTVRTITQLNEGPWRWNFGIQAGVATGVTISLFYVLGYPMLGTIASLGALSVLYGSKRSPPERLLVMLLVGAGIVVSAAIGVTFAGHTWLGFVALLMIAGVTGLIARGSGIGPPGPVIFVLVAAISNRLALPGAVVTFFPVPLLVAAGVVVAWSVVALLSISSHTAVPAQTEGVVPLTWKLRFTAEDWLVTGRTVVGIAAAVLLSKTLGIVRIHWVIIAVTAILQAGFDRKLTTVRAFQRVLGTILGVVIFEIIHLFPLTGIWIIFLVALLQFGTEVVIARNYVLGLLFITPMALTIASINTPDTAHITSRERVIDTLIGAALAVLVFWVEALARFLVFRIKKQ